MHAGAVQRKSRVYRPGLTKAQTSSRVSPLAMTDDTGDSAHAPILPLGVSQTSL
jgi:hypothetical protein